MDLDLRLLQWIAAHRCDAISEVARTLMAGGGSRALGLGLLAAFVLGIVIEQIGAVWVAILAGGSASAVATALKALVDRPRPPADLALVTTTGSSMPSTIAALTAGTAVGLVVALRWPSRGVRRVAVVVLCVIVAVVGAAMIYLGAHWLSDVLVGWALGGAVACGFGIPFTRLRRAVGGGSGEDRYRHRS